MIQATILAPLVLVAVLVVSAVAKLRDPSSLDEGFRQLRVPAALSQPWLRRVVPWLELALALGLLLPAPISGLAAAGSLVLFAVYTWLIVRAWRAPQEASCNCFGSLTTGKVTGWTVVRNVVLVGLSLVAIVDAVAASPLVLRLGDGGVLAWVAGAAVVALLVFAIVHDGDAGPSAAEAPVVPEADEEGEFVRLPIPFARLTTPSGDRVTMRDLARTKAQLLLYVSLGCGSCQDVISAMPRWQAAMPEVAVRPVVWKGGATPEQFGELGENLLLDEERAMSLLELHGTPAAVLLGADGLIAGGPVSGTAAITDLVEGMIEQLVEARGEPAVVVGEVVGAEPGA